MFVRHLTAVLAVTLAMPTGRLAAQDSTSAPPQQRSATEYVALGDSAYTALDAPKAYEYYKEAIAADSTNYPALWKAARTAVDLGEFEPDKAKKKQYYADGEAYGRRAVATDSTNAEGHFALARALGRVALTLGAGDRVKYAKIIREQALDALKYDSLHAGALHVMGMWNAEIMRLSGFSRFFAKTFLGASMFNAASWDSAVYYMEKSVHADSVRIIHHLDFGEILRDRDHDGDKQRAREQLEDVINGKVTEYNDPHYKAQAEKDLAKLH